MRASILLLLAISTFAAELRAQFRDLRPGSRIRVWTPAPGRERIRGELLAPVRDTVIMRGGIEKRFGRAGREIPRSFPLTGLERLEVSDGRARLTGALQGAALGASVSVAYGGLIWIFSSLSRGGIYDQSRVDPLKSMAVASIAVVPICALIRGLNGPDKWRRVYPAR